MRRLFAFALCGLLAACGGTAPTRGTGATQGQPDTGPSGPTGDSNETTTMPSGAGPTGGALLVGRFDLADENEPTFSWPNSTIAVTFTGSSLRIGLVAVTPGTSTSKQDDYDVWQDGVLSRTLSLEPNATDYVVATGLPAGAHRVEVVKRTESRFSTGRLLSVAADTPNDLLPCSASARRIEFVGDSITAGYGAEATNPNDAVCQLNFGENAGASYAQLVGHDLEADISNISWAGVGVLNAVNGSDTAVSLYGRTIGTDATTHWAFAWIPQVVVINLGTNDVPQAAANPDAFRDAYAELLGTIRQHYPQAHLLCLVGPMLDGQDLANIDAGIDAALQARASAGDTNASMLELTPDDGSRGYGCAQHPVAATHVLIASQVEQRIKQLLGW